MKIEKISLQSLKLYANNNKKHPKEQIAKIIASIKNFGFNVPMIIDKDNYIIAGHGRYYAAKEIGMDLVPCIVKENLSDDEIKAYRIMDNKSAESEYDFDALKLEFEELKQNDFDLELTGFEIEEIDDLLKSDDETEVIEDDFDENVNEIETDIKLGDVFELGNHRLMCGDSTDFAMVKELTEDNKADMCFTDPPYGVSYSNNMNKKFEVIKNDDKILNFIPVLEKICKLNSHWYIWTSHQVYNIWRELIKEFYKNTIIWSKGGLGIGDLKGDYAVNYELCFFCQFGRRELNNREGAVWNINKDNTSGYIHPTQKPIALSAKAIKNSSRENETVLDLFGGSGSTLIACEQLNRKCYMMELDPKYVQTIINRWEKLTNNIARKLNI